MREGLSTELGTRRTESGLSGPIFSGPHDCAWLVNFHQVVEIVLDNHVSAEHFDFRGTFSRRNRNRTSASSGSNSIKLDADRFAQDLAPVLADIRAAGHLSLRAIAAELTARGIRTRRDGRWGVGNVKALLERGVG